MVLPQLAAGGSATVLPVPAAHTPAADCTPVAAMVLAAACAVVACLDDPVGAQQLLLQPVGLLQGPPGGLAVHRGRSEAGVAASAKASLGAALSPAAAAVVSAAAPAAAVVAGAR